MEDEEAPPPSLGAKCCDLSHLKSGFGKLQVIQFILTFVTFLSGIFSKMINSNVPKETQLVGLISVFGFSLIFDLIGFAFLHFNLDNAFQLFQDRPYIFRTGKILFPMFIGLCQMFSLLAAVPMTLEYMNITMFLGFLSSLSHIVQIDWIRKLFSTNMNEDRRSTELRRTTYMRSADPLPDVFDSASIDEFPPTHSVTFTSIKKKRNSNSSKSSISSKSSVNEFEKVEENNGVDKENMEAKK